MLENNLWKKQIKRWFIQRAESRGIPWRRSAEDLAVQQAKLDQFYLAITDRNIKYPPYYLQNFHGYKLGNLCWEAAYECESATLSMALNYWGNNHTAQWTQDKFRYSINKLLIKYYDYYHPNVLPQTIVDIGFSVGVSTCYLKKAFPNAHFYGVDLSPYFLSVAALRYENISWIHSNAENTSFKDNTISLTTLCFLIHELPQINTLNILQEMYRIISPGGVILIVDLDPLFIKSMNYMMRKTFEVTEPHIAEYYDLDIHSNLEKIGFNNISSYRSDPRNRLILATK